MEKASQDQNREKVSFDLHDTLLVFKLGGRLTKYKFFRMIFYALSNFRPFIFTYTFFSRRNEKVLALMEKAKKEGKEVIILTSTYRKCAKVVFYFLKKNGIRDYDRIIFRQKLTQSEEEYKIEEMEKNAIKLHYDDSARICAAVNKAGRSCVVVEKH